MMNKYNDVTLRKMLQFHRREARGITDELIRRDQYRADQRRKQAKNMYYEVKGRAAYFKPKRITDIVDDLNPPPAHRGGLIKELILFAIANHRKDLRTMKNSPNARRYIKKTEEFIRDARHLLTQVR
jgi:hypothetical protein